MKIEVSPRRLPYEEARAASGARWQIRDFIISILGSSSTQKKRPDGGDGVKSMELKHDNHQQHRLSSHCDLSSWFLLLLHPWCVDVAVNKILHTLLVALLVEYLVLFCSPKSECVDHNLPSASDVEARRNKSGIVAEEETIEAMP